jgi:hypothetical protein
MGLSEGVDKIVALVLVAFGSIAVVVIGKWLHSRRVQKSTDWPMVQGYISQAVQGRDGSRLPIVTLTYTYKVNGERYAGSEIFDFQRDETASLFTKECKDREVEVHYRPSRYTESVMARDQSGAESPFPPSQRLRLLPRNTDFQRM